MLIAKCCTYYDITQPSSKLKWKNMPQQTKNWKQFCQAVLLGDQQSTQHELS